MSTQSTYPTPAVSGPPRATRRRDSAPAATATAPDVEIVLPVYNEERGLAAGVLALHEHLSESAAFTWQITIAENASTDATPRVADELAAGLEGVAVLHLSEKGRGRALRAAWAASRAEVVAYMDIDLSTGLEALGPLVEPLLAGRGDVAIGSRLVPGARVTRSLRREVISRAYNLLLGIWLDATFADAQCGFKAARREAVRDLLAEVRDDGWFFDTELLYLAQRAKLAIREVPVCWVEDRDSRVAIVATALADLRGIARLRRRAGGRPSAAGASAQAPPRPQPQPSAPAGEASHDHTLRPRRPGPRRGYAASRPSSRPGARTGASAPAG